MAVTTVQNTKNKRSQNVVSALTARTKLGQILKRASEKDERFVVDRGGKPSVIIMSVRDYIRTIAPTTPSLRAIQQEAKRNGTANLTMAEIDREIAIVRKQKSSKKTNKQTKR
jgi:prevent-host-death family protein